VPFTKTGTKLQDFHRIEQPFPYTAPPMEPLRHQNVWRMVNRRRFGERVTELSDFLGVTGY